MKKIMNNKIFNIITSVIEWILCIILIFLIILTGVQRFSKQGNFFGYRIFVVASNSMTPQYKIGDALLVKEVPKDTLKEGDVVTYKGKSGAVKDLTITHQIIKIEKNEDKLVFHTKGLANIIEDPLVEEEQILGKVTRKLKVLSVLGDVVSNKGKLLLFITLPIAFLIAIEIIKIVYKKE